MNQINYRLKSTAHLANSQTFFLSFLDQTLFLEHPLGMTYSRPSLQTLQDVSQTKLQYGNSEAKISSLILLKPADIQDHQDVRPKYHRVRYLTISHFFLQRL